jgi:hypothetical protein
VNGEDEEEDERSNRDEESERSNDDSEEEGSADNEEADISDEEEEDRDPSDDVDKEEERSNDNDEDNRSDGEEEDRRSNYRTLSERRHENSNGGGTGRRFLQAARRASDEVEQQRAIMNQSEYSRETTEEDTQTTDDLHEREGATKRKRTSQVWDHIEISNGKKRCKWCGTTWALSTSTTNLSGHLKKCEKHQQYLDMQPQTVVHTFQQKRAEELLSTMMARNALPLHLVVNEDFNEFIRYLKPGFKVPDRKTLTVELLPKLQEKVKKEMMKRKKDILQFSCTFDSWTSLANQNYMAVTYHGINRSWQRVSFVLGVLPVKKKSETADYVVELLEEVLERWGLSGDDMIGTTTDGASVMKKAAREMDIPWFHCIAHSVNLMVEAGLKQPSIRELLQKATKICKYFRRSTKAAKELAEHVNNETTVTKLKLYSKTRWNSAYDMIHRMEKLQTAIQVALVKLQYNVNCAKDLAEADWTCLGRVRKALKPFYLVTTELSGLEATVGQVWPVIASLRTHLTKPSDSNRVALMKEEMVKKLRGLFPSFEKHEGLRMATMLDPRYKPLSFLQSDKERDRMLSATKKELLMMLEQEPKQRSATRERTRDVPSAESSRSTKAKQKDMQRKKALQKLFGVEPNAESAYKRSVEDELKAYFREENLDIYDEDGKMNSPLLST